MMNNEIDTIRSNTIQRTGDRVQHRVDKYVRDIVCCGITNTSIGYINMEIGLEVWEDVWGELKYA